MAIGRDQDQLNSLKTESPGIETICADLSDWNATNSVLANTGPIDLLVNNAGLGWVKPITEITEQDVDR